MPDLNPNVIAFRQHFDVFDNAAHGGNRDNLVSRADIEAVANGSQYSAEQRAAARYLLDHPEEMTLLDTGHHGGGIYDADGKISREDVNAVFADQPLFSDTGTFVSNAAVIPPNPPRDLNDPAAAAWQTENVARNGTGDRDASATNQFMSFVREHQNDPAWLQQYFRMLGGEQTARYLNNVASPNRYHGGSADFANGEMGALRTALEGLYQTGRLNDADIGRLVEHWALQGGDMNPGLAELFGGLRGPNADSMKNAFGRAATELAMSDRNLNNRQFTFSPGAHVSDGDRKSLIGAAAYVLGQSSWENRNNQLIILQRDGGNEAVERFFTLAMANPTEVAGVTAFTADAQRSRQEGQSPLNLKYDGAAQLIESLSHDTTYRGGPDRFLPPSPYSYQQLQDIRDVVFYTACNEMQANSDQWANNTTLKDGLSRILTSDFDRLVAGSLSPNGGRIDDDSPLPKALEIFSKYVLFTEPSGSMRDYTSKFLVDRLSTTITDVGKLSDADFSAKYNAQYGITGTDKQAQVHLAGDLLGYIDNGMEQAVALSSDKYAENKARLEFGIELAWAVGKDAVKLLPGGNVVSNILPKSVTDSESYKAIQGQVEDALRTGATDKAVELLLKDKHPDLKMDEVLGGLARELSDEAPVAVLAELLSSHSDVDANPANA